LVIIGGDQGAIDMGAVYIAIVLVSRDSVPSSVMDTNLPARS
jgi:hypothetical protein